MSQVFSDWISKTSGGLALAEKLDASTTFTDSPWATMNRKSYQYPLNSAVTAPTTSSSTGAGRDFGYILSAACVHGLADG